MGRPLPGPVSAVGSLTAVCVDSGVGGGLPCTPVAEDAHLFLLALLPSHFYGSVSAPNLPVLLLFMNPWGLSRVVVVCVMSTPAALSALIAALDDDPRLWSVDDVFVWLGGAGQRELGKCEIDHDARF